MSDYDLIIRNGFVVDGTGLPRRRVDVGIRNGRVDRGGVGARTARQVALALVEPVDLACHGWLRVASSPAGMWIGGFGGCCTLRSARKRS